ncbi:MAG: hypothetical protein HY699_12935 [Deltaproteobacteria bacterium]|nr:hypothetical protein [Deltaproteobacteria bacterium]
MFSNTGTAVDARRHVFGTGMRLGGDFGGIRAHMMGAYEAPLYFRFPESLGAMTAYGTRTGRRDVRGVLEVARAYDLPPVQLAGTMGQLGALGRLPSETIRERRVEMTLEEVQAEVARRQQLRRLGRPLSPMADMMRTERYATGGLPSMLHGAYGRSAWGGNDAFMSDYLSQYAQLVELQASGGAPVLDYGSTAERMAIASRLYGGDINPAISGRTVGAFMQVMAQPQNTALRAAQLRALMGLDPTTRRLFADAGYDLGDYVGASAAMENVFSLPRELQTVALHAMAGGRYSLYGRGTAAERMALKGETGSAYQALQLQKLFDQFVSAEPGTGQEGDLAEKLAKKLAESGPEAGALVIDAGKEKLAIAVTTGIKELGQSITDDVIQLADSIRQALAYWNQEVSPRIPGAAQ